MESFSVRMENVLIISWCVIKNMIVKTSRMKINVVSIGSIFSKILNIEYICICISLYRRLIE